MKTKKEIAQFEALADALQSVSRIALDDEEASVRYDAEADAFRLASRDMTATASVWGDNAKAATCDFVNKTIGKLIY